MSSSEEAKLSLGEVICRAINERSLENGSNTPEHILASYLVECLEVFDRATRAREKWYGRESSTAAGGS